MSLCRTALMLAAWLPVLRPGFVRADEPITGNPARELADYVSAPDTSYAWRELQSSRYDSAEIVELSLISQTWRGIPWKHQLVLVRPPNMDPESRQVFLFVHGGRWKPEYENGFQGKLPSQTRIFTRLAKTLKAPVAVLRQVPFQPIFERREDALIAYTFDQYLNGGESDWPLLLPMVKSTVRAMDAVQAYTRERWQMPVESFTLAGASKRGWTSWLTAAVEPRVASVAPMVIDMLNIPAQISLQRATFGGLSEQVQDYVNSGFVDRVDSERGRSLLAIVDPYSYRSDLTPPKLILLGTNDRYWPLDALRVYWDGLPEPKRVLYVPNQGHGVKDLDRLIGSLSALHRYTRDGRPLPAVSWSYGAEPDRLNVDVQSDRKPRRVRAWTATSATRDFRDARWRSQHCRRNESGFSCGVARPREGFVALYGELWFKDSGYPQFPLSTVVCIAGKAGTDAPDC